VDKSPLVPAFKIARQRFTVTWRTFRRLGAGYRTIGVHVKESSVPVRGPQHTCLMIEKWPEKESNRG
jgi:hypothetical protein